MYENPIFFHQRQNRVSLEVHLSLRHLPCLWYPCKDSDLVRLVFHMDDEYCFKILMRGDDGVGKSCLLLRFTDNTFNDSFIGSIGVDFKFRTVTINSTNIKLQIWDPSGQEKFRTISTTPYRGYHGVVLAFDITSQTSFDNLKRWLKEINTYAGETIKKIIVGNKIDLLPTRAIATETAKDFCESYKIPYIETSTKDSTNVENVFLIIAQEILESMSKKTGERISKIDCCGLC